MPAAWHICKSNNPVEWVSCITCSFLFNLTPLSALLYVANLSVSNRLDSKKLNFWSNRKDEMFVIFFLSSSRFTATMNKFFIILGGGKGNSPGLTEFWTTSKKKTSANEHHWFFFLCVCKQNLVSRVILSSHKNLWKPRIYFWWYFQELGSEIRQL